MSAMLNNLAVFRSKGYYIKSLKNKKENLLNIVFFLNLTSAVLFLFYGLHCLFSEKMVWEFNRYRLAQYRILTGVLEVLGAIGQLAGLGIPLLSVVSSAGLALLMVLGVWTRWRIQDPWYAFIPAILLGMVNGVLVGLQLN